MGVECDGWGNDTSPVGGKKELEPTEPFRSKLGTKRSLLVDGNGIPLAVVVDGALRHDMKLLEAILEAQQMLPTDLEPGTQRHLCLDKGYDYDDIRQVRDSVGRL